MAGAVKISRNFTGRAPSGWTQCFAKSSWGGQPTLRVDEESHLGRPLEEESTVGVRLADPRQPERIVRRHADAYSWAGNAILCTMQGQRVRRDWGEKAQVWRKAEPPLASRSRFTIPGKNPPINNMGTRQCPEVELMFSEDHNYRIKRVRTDLWHASDFSFPGRAEGSTPAVEIRRQRNVSLFYEEVLDSPQRQYQLSEQSPTALEIESSPSIGLK